MKEIYLSTSSESVLLPITPAEIGVDSSVNIFRQGVIKIGEIPHFNGVNLRSVSIASFFPNQDYYFAFATKLKTYDLANKLHSWQVSNQPLRLVVTGTGINMIVTILSFNTKEQDGTGDLYYELELLEYKNTSSVSISSSSSSAGSSTKRTNDSIDIQDKNESKKQKLHKVKKGDTLIDIAKQYFGNTNYKVIQEANISKYPSLKSTTIIQIGWELIIP